MPPGATPNDPAKLQSLLHSIIAFFGLPTDASAGQVMAALKAVKDQASAPPDPAKYMPVAAVQAMLEQRKAERGQDTEKRIAVKVEAPCATITSRWA